MRVVVTGGAGLLGSHFCDALLADGQTLLCADNLLTGRMENLEQLVD
jgi:UDP-glucose 4-epimerase